MHNYFQKLFCELLHYTFISIPVCIIIFKAFLWTLSFTVYSIHIYSCLNIIPALSLLLYGNFACHNSLVISLLFLPAQFFSLSCSCLLSLLFMSHCILPVISIIFMHYVYICHHSVWSAVTLDNTVLSLTCQSFLGSSFKCLLWLSGWHLYFFLFQTECGISEKHIQY